MAIDNCRYECCERMGYELVEKHIIHNDYGKWFLKCMNPIDYCPFCGILLPTIEVGKE